LGLGDPAWPPDLEGGPGAAAGPVVVAGCGRNGRRRWGQAVGEIREGGVKGEGGWWAAARSPSAMGGGGGRRWWGSTPESREDHGRVLTGDGHGVPPRFAPAAAAGAKRGRRWRGRGAPSIHAVRRRPEEEDTPHDHNIVTIRPGWWGPHDGMDLLRLGVLAFRLIGDPSPCRRVLLTIYNS
jgi:hypothetical protein